MTTEKRGIANKLTIAEMGLTKEILQAALADKPDGFTIPIALMFGKTAKYLVKPSKLDPTRDDVCFVGEFEGHNLLDGSVHNAAKAYLPGAAEPATRSAVDNCADGEAVEFGCEIAVKKKTSAAVGYVFGVSVPRTPQAQDPLAGIRAQMQSLAAPAAEAPALPSPAKEKGKKDAA